MRQLPRLNRFARLTVLALWGIILSACQASPSTVAPIEVEVSPTPPPASAGQTLDDFESGATPWQAGLAPEYPDSSAVQAVLTGEGAAQGKQALALSFDLTSAPKAIFFWNGQFDLSGAERLVFELDDPAGSLEAAALSLSTGETWLWHESAPMAVQAGQNTLVFDLSASIYQTDASDWQPTARLADLNDTRRIAILLYPKAAGTVYLDHLRLVFNGDSLPLSPTAAGVRPQAEPVVYADCPGQVKQPASEAPLAIFLSGGTQIETPLKQGRLVEFDLSAALQVDNPYDPAQIDLMVHVTAPDGSAFSIPAFWAQPFDPSTHAPCGRPGWKARLTPTQAGPWQVQAEIIGQDIRSELLRFEAAPGEGIGLIRRHPTHSSYLAFEDGSTFFPVGINIGWWQDSPLEDYTRWLDRLSQNGGNTIRVWMASWSFGIEWNDTGLGNYDQRQYRAWLLDQLFALAQARGVYIELVLLNHGAFSQNVNPEWEHNPYNAANGGPLDNPARFAADETARDYFKRRLRYIAARWGYAPNLLAWEWWNEVNWTPIPEKDLVKWVGDMTAYLKTFDPYHHLVSISYAMAPSIRVLQLPEIDFNQYHVYSPLDPVLNFPTDLRWSQQLAPGKPWLFAEFGSSAAYENSAALDRAGLHLHNGLWAATFSGYASPAMYWWWDSYVDPLNLWGQFAGLTHFLAGEDLATLRILGPGKLHLSDSSAYVMALYHETRLLAWVRQVNYEIQELEKAYRYGDQSPDWQYTLDPLEGLILTVSGLADGDYLARWFDPASGEVLAESPVQVQAGSLSLAIPSFSADLALKVIPAGP